MDSFLTFINQHGLDPNNCSTLLAVSGGVDSVVMAHLFHKMGLRAGIAHCNFGLRGIESEEDEEFVKVLALGYGFEFYSKKFDTKTYSKDHAISTQMAARELRYDWFGDVRVKHQYNWIATAHHADDSFETVLLNLVRGTGIRGLSGIAAQNDKLLRPMLLVTKEEVLAYAEENRLSWREDRSNDTDDYKRNMIRHHVIPVFQQLNPSIKSTFKTTSAKLRSANILLDELLQKWKRTIIRNEEGVIRISIQNLLSSSESSYRLWYILEEYGFAYSQSGSIIDSLKGIPGKTFCSPTHILLIDRTDLILKKSDSADGDYELQIDTWENQVFYEGHMLQFLQRERDSSPENCNSTDTIMLDGEKLVYPLKIRNWRQGDKFYPLGMGGKGKKLSDFFVDRKIDRFQKKQVRLLLNGNGDIIWVIGIRADERYKADGFTKDWIVISRVDQSDFNKI